MQDKKPLVSIVTPYYRNGEKWIERYFESLRKQTFKDFEIIFVDNGSSDGVIDNVRSNYPEAKIVTIKKNKGIVVGKNLGVSHAKGNYIVLLDNDVWIDKNYLKNLLVAYVKIPRASIFQTKILLMNEPEKIDSCGSFWTNTGFIYHYGNGKPALIRKYNKPFPLFCVKSASMIFKRDVLDKIGLYYNFYWGFYEESDFCHRAWIAGFETWYWPEAVAYHSFGGTSLTYNSDFLQYHNFKNKLFSFMTNFEIRNLLHLIPKFIVFNFVISLAWIVQGKFKHALSLIRAFIWNIKNISLTLKVRREVQTTRRLSDKQIDKYGKVNPDILYYYHLFTTHIENYKDKSLPRAPKFTGD